MKKFWDWISCIGVRDGLEPFEAKSTTFVNRILVVFAVILLSSIFVNLLLGTFLFVPALSSALIAVFFTYYLNSIGFYTLGKLVLFFMILSLLLYMSFNGGYGSGLEFYFISLAVLPFVFFRNRNINILLMMVSIVALAVQKFNASVAPDVDVDTLPHKVFYVINSFYSVVAAVLIIRFFRNVNQRSEEQLKQKNQQIEEKNQQLEEVNKELDTFTYSVSHDLQAPLRTINGFINLIGRKNKDALTEETQGYFNRIVNNTHKMGNLIDNLLALSRFSRKELNKVRVNMTELAETVAEDVRKSQPGREVEIRVGPLPSAFADRDLMYQVLYNLIANAVKFSSKRNDPLVEVSGEQQGKRMVYRVKDNGVGFDKQYQEKLFAAFQRLHSAEEFPGTGVGLSIVKKVVERHGGDVWAESELEQGAVFGFSVPVREGK